MSVFTFNKDGVAIHKALVSDQRVQFIIAGLGSDYSTQHGIRNPEKKFAVIAKLVSSARIIALASELLQAEARFVRALFFDKMPGKNWFTAWHQDKTVALDKKIPMTGWGPWTVKQNVCHVQPPVEVLDAMVTIRLHLDRCDTDNGCLLVKPGSYQAGILDQAAIDKLAMEIETVPCVVASGDAVVMRPHILHASKKVKLFSDNQSHRRVVHMEFSSYQLPQGLDWA